MKNPPAFQLYASDFYMDTLEWSATEVGIYFRLLMSEWINGSLPNDEKKLARIAGIDPGNFKKAWVQDIANKFSPNGDGNLINQRMEEVRAQQEEYRKKQQESGYKGIEIKKKKGIYPFDKLNNPSSNPARVEQALQSSSSSLKNKEKDIQFLFPLKDKNKSYVLGSEKVKEYQNTYQNINVIQELKDCVQWNRDNEDKRKTEKGILRHVYKWISKASKDKGYIAKAQEPDKEAQQERDEYLDQFTVEELRANRERIKAIGEKAVKKA